MRTRLATTSHTSHAASSASLTLPHSAKAAISETMDIAGTSFPAKRYSSDTRWGRNSADRADSGAGRVAKFRFCVGKRTTDFGMVWRAPANRDILSHSSSGTGASRSRSARLAAKMSSPSPDTAPALLVLADGTIFRGISVGAPGLSSGEVVFNTAITGYQEILTDPSYCRQIVTLTHPHIGNTGTNAEDMESAKVFAAGLVVRDVPARVSSWRAQSGLRDFLVANGVPGIAGLDTRRLTRILREKGSQNGAVLAGSDDVERALAAARGFPGLAGMDLAKVVSTRAPYEWSQAKWRTGGGFEQGPAPRFRVFAYDYGVKRNILRLLVERGCRVTVLPAQTPAAEALALKPDGVFLSNGPAAPEPCDYAIE